MAITSYRPDGGKTGWIRSSFMLPPGAMSDHELKLRTTPNGSFKFSDTTVGGNQAINPPPQFTHLCDLNEVRIGDRPNDEYSFTNAGRGMGRWYSENIDTPAVLVHMRFGVPTFSSMTSFFGNFYNSGASRLARTGRGDGLAYSLGRIAGTVATLHIQPYILLGRMLKFLLDMPSTKYCSLKPAMALYHMATASILNSIAADAGFVIGMSNTERNFDPTKQESGFVNTGYEKLLPDVYNSNGSIDTFKIFTRYQRLSNRRYRALKQAFDVSGDTAAVRKAVSKIYNSPAYGPNSRDISEFKDMDAYLDAYFGTSMAFGAPLAPNVTVPPIPAGQEERDAASKAVAESGKFDLVKDYASETSETLYGAEGEPDPGILKFLMAELNDGGQFITFRIDNPGTSSESFQNQVKDSGIKQKMDGMSSGARSTRFNMMDGQVMGGVLGATIGAITNVVSDFIGGIGDSIGISGIGQVFGNSMVDIPKYWDGSTANLPKTDMSISLQSWSGDPLSRYQNLMIPLAMLLAGALPRSTGYSSYTAPFVLEYYCKGRSSSRYAIIDSLNITRGTGNLGFTEDCKPLAIDISLSVIDLSSVMHMPLQSAFSPTQLLSAGGISKLLFSDTSAFTDYMATLSSVGLVDQVYTTKRLKRNFHRTALAFGDWLSPAHWASVASNGLFLGTIAPGRFATIFTNVTDLG